MGNGNGQGITSQRLPGGRGNTEIVTKADLTYGNRSFAFATAAKIVQARLANPTANGSLLAKLTGHCQPTVYNILKTPYAQRQLQQLADDQIELVRNKLADTAGNAIVFVDKSIERGAKEIDAKRPEPSILTNARQASELVLKGTGLLAETIRVQQAGKGLQDYTADDDLVALQQVTAKVSRETPSSKG